MDGSSRAMPRAHGTINPRTERLIRYFPIFLDLRGRRVLVLGSGAVAARKAEWLARAGAEPVHATTFRADLLDGCALAIGADAPDDDLRALSAAAHGAGIPVNVVDRPELCSFISPAVVDRDPVTVAISSAGTAPVLARDIRARIEAMLPPATGRLAELLEGLRPELRSALPDPAARRRAIDRILAGPAAALARAGDMQGAQRAARAVLDAPQESAGMVFLLGAGPGDPDLLTLRAHRLLATADVVVHGPGVSAAALDMARRDAQRIAAPPPLSPLLMRLARAGQYVACLVRDRPEAEAAALAACGIACEIVPGVLLCDPPAVDR